MSSRTENGDAWRQHDDRTADRGPGRMLSLSGNLAARLSAGNVPGRHEMTSGGRPAGQDEPGRSRGPGEQYAGWSVFSYLISGMVVYGAIGWLVGHWTHLPLLFPLGMLAGLGVAILLIVLKYGRS